MQLKHRDGSVIYDLPNGTFRETMEFCAKTQIDMRGLDAISSAEGDTPGAAPFVGADLRGFKLTGAMLEDSLFQDADLSGAVLNNSNMRGSDLKNSRLVKAKLRGANLSETKCRRADMTQADLRGVDFRDADLRVTDFRSCDMRTANLVGAKLDSLTNMANVNLAGANLTGETWEEYLHDFLPKFLTSNGKRLIHVIEGWDCHNWASCPMAIAFGVNRPEDAPREIRARLHQFVRLYDLKIIPKPVLDKR